MTELRDGDAGGNLDLEAAADDHGIRRRKRGSLTQYLGRAIVSGEFKPGDIMFGEVAQ